MANTPATVAAMATNPPKSFRTAHLIEVEEQSDGKMTRLHGYMATTPATTPPLEETGTSDWDTESHDLIQWFLSTKAPADPFQLQPGVWIANPARWWHSISADIALGPGGSRWRAMQFDLRKMHAIFAEGNADG